jgi:hypothetical protein
VPEHTSAAVSRDSSDAVSRAWLFRARIGGIVLVALYALRRLADAEHWDLLDDLNLAVHEAGHLVFAPFGEMMATLGGSLFQVLVPLAFVLSFARTRQRFAAAITLAWVGASLLNVSRYIGDARAQELPLLGGENAVHDWWWILIEWDLLARDLVIARAVHASGALAFVGAVAIGAAAALADARQRGATAADRRPDHT